MVRSTDPFRRAREIGVAVGTTVGLAYRAGRVPLDPDKVWVARVRLSPRIAAYDASVRVPATRSAADDVWVRAQIARRNAHVRRLAELAGIDPDTALEAARTVGLGAVFAGRFKT